MARTRNPERTRARLFEATREVYSPRCYAIVSVTDIARKAGLTTGAIYGNFTGKADLFMSLLESMMCSATDSLDAKLEGAQSTGAVVQAVIAHFKQLRHEDPLTLRLYSDMCVVAFRDEVVRERVSHLMKCVERSLERAIVKVCDQSGVVVPVNAQHMAKLLASTLDGVVLRERVAGDDGGFAMLELLLRQLDPQSEAAWAAAI